MKKLIKINLSLVVASIISLSFLGCGSNDSSSSGKKITGYVTGNGYASNSIDRFLDKIITKAYALDVDSPNKIVVMYNKGREQKEFDINPDGSFEIDTGLLSKNDLVILVVNSFTKKIFGHLNLGTSSDAKLDFIDKSKLVDDLSFGNIDTENNCTSDVTLSNTTSFSSEDLETMEEIAISDNALVLYQNKYKSPDYDAEVQVLYNMDSLDSIKDTWSNIDDFNTSNLIGLRPTIDTDLASFNDIDENSIFLYPPSDVNFTTQRDGNFNQTADSSTPILATYKNSDDGNFYEFSFVNSFPQGDWILKIQGSDDIKATFIFSAAYPYDDNGKSIVPVPQIRLNMDSNDNTKIKSVDVRWYIYDGTQYIQVDDDFMNSIALQDNDSDKFIVPLRDNYGQDIAIFESTTWNGTYTLPGGASVTLPADNRRINMKYNIGQVSYQFLFQ